MIRHIFIIIFVTPGRRIRTAAAAVYDSLEEWHNKLTRGIDRFGKYLAG